jgi:hypothetical protein
MNWQTLVLLIIAFVAIALLHARTIPKRRRVFMLVWLVVAVLIYRWANYRSAWLEVGIAAGVSLVLFFIWWFAYGRALPTPSDDDIRVWSEDDPF